ncbi:MAG: rubrerythrin family protein [Chloroflexi bacterium]|nr:rubrerythrin family protein [Chloroflexota bacterium]
MPLNALDANTRAALLEMQREEITGHHIYLQLARSVKDEHNRNVLRRIAAEERRHYESLRALTGATVAPRRWRVVLYYWLSRIVGLTFGIKLLERGEEQAQANYDAYVERIPLLGEILAEEQAHEDELLAMLDEEALQYAGSVVLGLNDALVELTGALAGYSLAFQNTRLIALTGLITGISASLSMAASEYLSTRAEEGEQRPLRAALYTGLAYVFTVALLVAPFLIIHHYLVCLALTLIMAVLVIAVFNYYLSVVRDENFRRRFAEMALISLGVAALSFAIGYLVRALFGIEV